VHAAVEAQRFKRRESVPGAFGLPVPR